MSRQSERNPQQSNKGTRISSSLRNWIIFLLVVVLVGGFFYLEMRKDEFGGGGNENLESGELGLESGETLPENPPDNVMIKDLGDGKRLVTDPIAGYDVEVGKDLYLYKDKLETEDLVIQDFKEPIEGYGGTPGCRVITDYKNGNLNTIEQDTKAYCDARSDCQSFNLNEVKLNDVNWFVVRYSGEFVGAGNPRYITEKNGSVYSFYFQCDDKSFIEGVLGSVSLN